MYRLPFGWMPAIAAAALILLSASPPATAGNLRDALVNFRKAKAIAPDSVVVANNLQLLQSTAAAARA